MSELTVSTSSAPAHTDAPLVRSRTTVGLCALAVVIAAFFVLPLDRAVIAAGTGATLVVLSAIDLERGIIPNRIVLPAAGLVLAAQLMLFGDRAIEWLLAAIVSAFVLALPQLIGRRWMGMGDAKLALLLGAALGWGVFGALLLAFLCVFPLALLMLARGGLAARKTTIPFGPFLSLGGLIMLFVPYLA